MMSKKKVHLRKNNPKLNVPKLDANENPYFADAGSGLDTTPDNHPYRLEEFDPPSIEVHGQWIYPNDKYEPLLDIDDTKQLKMNNQREGDNFGGFSGPCCPCRMPRSCCCCCCCCCSRATAPCQSLARQRYPLKQDRERKRGGKSDGKSRYSEFDKNAVANWRTTEDAGMDTKYVNRAEERFQSEVGKGPQTKKSKPVKRNVDSMANSINARAKFQTFQDRDLDTQKLNTASRKFQLAIKDEDDEKKSESKKRNIDAVRNSKDVEAEFQSCQDRDLDTQIINTASRKFQSAVKDEDGAKKINKKGKDRKGALSIESMEREKNYNAEFGILKDNDLASMRVNRANENFTTAVETEKQSDKLKSPAQDNTEKQSVFGRNNAVEIGGLQDAGLNSMRVNHASETFQSALDENKKDKPKKRSKRSKKKSMSESDKNQAVEFNTLKDIRLSSVNLNQADQEFKRAVQKNQAKKTKPKHTFRIESPNNLSEDLSSNDKPKK